jgi:hypothetical protein
MSDYGIRISATGIDVKTGADKDMIVTSKCSMLKGSISGSGTVSVVRDSTTTTVTIAHGLGYIPMVTAYWNDRDFDIYDSGFYFPMPTYLNAINFRVRADSTNIYLDFSINEGF